MKGGQAGIWAAQALVHGLDVVSPAGDRASGAEKGHGGWVLSHQPAHAALVERVQVLHDHPPHPPLPSDAVRPGRRGRCLCQHQRHHQSKEHPNSHGPGHGGIQCQKGAKGSGKKGRQAGWGGKDCEEAAQREEGNSKLLTRG